MILATELWLLALNRPFADRRTRQREPIRDLWRVRIMWTGMAPIFIKATVQAVLGGPHRKPVYKVTRKEDDLRWHWRHTLPQTTLVLAVLIVLTYATIHRTFPNLVLLLGSIYWGGLNIVLLSGFVARGWHGLQLFNRSLDRTASPAEQAQPELTT